MEVFIDLGADVNLKCHGTPSLQLAVMVASLPSGLEFGTAAASLILTSSCDLTAKVRDCAVRCRRDGYTAESDAEGI